MARATTTSASRYRMPGTSTNKTECVAAGRFQGTATNLVNIAPRVFVDGVNDLFMYCYDIYESINHGQSVNYIVDFNGATERTLDFLGAVNSVMSIGKAYRPLCLAAPDQRQPGRRDPARHLGEPLRHRRWSLTDGALHRPRASTAAHHRLPGTASRAPSAAPTRSTSSYTMVLESRRRTGHDHRRPANQCPRARLAGTGRPGTGRTGRQPATAPQGTPRLRRGPLRRVGRASGAPDPVHAAA